MTERYENEIIRLRQQGLGYQAIAYQMGLPKSTIAYYCQTHNIEKIQKQEVKEKVEVERKTSERPRCRYCGRVLYHTSGKKHKLFCSQTCRLTWWAEHPELKNRKTFYQYRCPICNKTFKAYGNNHRKYCSRACYLIARYGEKKSRKKSA